MRQHLARHERVAAGGEGLKHAAVAIVVVGDPRDEAHFILTVRGGRLRSHAGQFALPGGRTDPGETPEQTALRELAEEVGLSLPPAHVLGLLDDYVTRAGHRVTPVVVWGERSPRLTANPDEVDDVYRVPLADLDRPGNPYLQRVPGSGRPVVHLSLLDTLVFAPTAALLYQFREVALHGREARVQQLDQPMWAWR